MTPQAFMHLPELEGRITPPEASGLRLTDEVLAAWDAQARAQGLPDDWRLPDADVERSRQAVLADAGGAVRPGQKDSEAEAEDGADDLDGEGDDRLNDRLARALLLHELL